MIATTQTATTQSTRACQHAMMAYARWLVKQDPCELRRFKEEQAKKFWLETIKESDTEYVFILHRANGTSRTSRMTIEKS